MSYPSALYPLPTGENLVSRYCVHCRNTIGLRRWDDLNGFLVLCPHCFLATGKPWSLNRTLMAGLFFNAFSFFFVFRPRIASLLFLAAAGWAVGVGSLAFGPTGPDWLQIVWGLVFFLGPPVVNAVELVRHEAHLDRAS